MKYLITGGAGYIGSHTCVELLNKGHEVVVVDNLMNSKEESIHRVRALTGRPFEFCKVDLLDKEALREVFEHHKFDGVVHFAGLKAVGESADIPLDYYHNNLTGTFFLCELMRAYGVKNLVFSSSATIYGNPEQMPLTEDFPRNAMSPYGRTKSMIEEILQDLYDSDNSWNITVLRYFNPIGAHESGKIGEDPNGIPNNLFPYISQVAVGKLPKLEVFGADYDTPDGTGIRDYIHVVDLARGHLKALEKLSDNPGYEIYNLGTGKGISVLDAIHAFQKVSGQEIPYEIVERRKGDIAVSLADPTKANKDLNWYAKKNLEDMCADSWRWQSNNPNGFG